MPVLVDLQCSLATIIFLGTSGVSFESTSGVSWTDDTGHLRVSTEDFADAHFWEGFIIGMSPIKWQMDTPYGGMIRFSVGSLDLALKALDNTGFWPMEGSYPRYFPIQIYWTADTEDNAILLFEGTAFIKNIDPPERVSLDLLSGSENTTLLSEEDDYDGNTVVLPIAFGTVTHVNPIRLPDAGGGNQRYSLGMIEGTVHTDWHVYDDGVDICSNVANVANNVFELTAAPVGEVTMSGRGIGAADIAAYNYTNIITIFETLCGSNYLNIPFVDLTDDGFNLSITLFAYVDVWQTDQISIFDFLSNITVSRTAFCYIHQGIMYLNDVYYPLQGSQTFNVQTECIEASLETQDPINLVTAAMEEAISFEGATSDPAVTAKYVKRIEHKVEYSSNKYPFGSTKEIDLYLDYQSRGYATWQPCLSWIEGYLNRIRGIITIPLGNLFYTPGYYLTVTDSRYSRDVKYVFFGYDITYDFFNKTTLFEGPAFLLSS